MSAHFYTDNLDSKKIDERLMSIKTIAYKSRLEYILRIAMHLVSEYALQKERLAFMLSFLALTRGNTMSYEVFKIFYLKKIRNHNGEYRSYRLCLAHLNNKCKCGDKFY